MHGNARGLKRGLFLSALFLMTAILATTSSSLTMAIEPSAWPSSAKDSGTPKKEPTEFQKQAQERLRRIAAGQDIGQPLEAGNTVTAQPFEATEASQSSPHPVSAVTRRKAAKASTDKVETAGALRPEPEKHRTLPAPEQAEQPAVPAASFSTTLLMRQVFDLNIGAYDSELGTPTPESIPVKWPAWEDVYFERETYRAKLEEFVGRDWSVGARWWDTRVTVACEQELNRGGPILFTVDYLPFTRSENLIIEVVQDTVREASGEVQRTVVRVKQGTYSAPAEGERGSLAVFAPILIVMGLLAAIGVVLLLNMLLHALAKAFFPDQWENPWTRRFLACCIGAAILIIIYLARLAI